MPTVSVIIPTYNHRDTVTAALGSVWAQTFADYEEIVVNDGSPDDTAEVLRPYAQSGRIRYVEQSNTGQAGARNRGIELAQGQFVALLDDDDLWPADKLAWQVDLLQGDESAVLAYGDVRRIDAQERELDWTPPYERFPQGKVERDFEEGCWLLSPGQALMRRSALREIGGFDRAIWGADDWDLYLRLAKIGRFAARRRVALYYRDHGGNASRQVLRHVRGFRAFDRKHPLPLWRHPLRRRRRRRNAAGAFCPALLKLSHERRLAGDFVTSLQAQRAAAALDPMLLFRREWAMPFALNLLKKSPRRHGEHGEAEVRNDK